jgi:hypothetical protein
VIVQVERELELVEEVEHEHFRGRENVELVRALDTLFGTNESSAMTSYSGRGVPGQAPVPPPVTRSARA